ncbi:type I-E CRISPR-associated protein Cas5/CasD [Roseomonas mucosa]|uniref:type I-E CRISPR-associated protein Cas5/CasD n=1 Tax=Roseomonas mucosa TaxID=207340 RepID=UPI00384E6A5F
MTDWLLLRLEAPLMSFGGPMVDQIGPTRRFPGQAQITGLLSNALGYRHGDADALEALQARLRLAAALVRPGEVLRDYQTVDLGRPHLVRTGWTTRGRMESREGASSETTHIRHRWYLTDALVVVALTLVPAGAAPDLSALGEALDHPARPLFIGRKPCLPTAPLRLGRLEAATAEDALCFAAAMLGHCEPIEAEIDARLASGAPRRGEREEHLVDRRDWRNQAHTGTRAARRLSLPMSSAPAATEPTP